MRTLLTAGAALGALLMASMTAQAGIVRSFSGSGSAGFLDPAGSSEPWVYGNPTDAFPTDVGWGSPGIGLGSTASNETVPVSDFEITFGSAIDPSSFTDAGTRFYAGATAWTAVFDDATPDSIAFDAPAGAPLMPGDPYLVNVFLSPGDGVLDGAFSGAWTNGAVPEPASLALLGTALLGFGLAWRHRKS